ncbi:MAG: rod shape-determining protein RodA [Bacteroidales bacterium]|nr:rod shape-determining protein RodA [Bacteroidales bacterium]
MRHRQSEYRKIDYLTIAIYAVIVIFGWANIYAAGYNEAHSAVFDFNFNHCKQLVWIGVSALVAGLILLTDLRFFSNGAYIFYAISMLLLLSVLFVGSSTNGGISWIDLKFFKLQPSEFAKFATALALSKYVSKQDFDIHQRGSWLMLGLIIALPVGLIFLQHDMGSALVFASFLIPLYRFGMTPYILVIGVVAITLFVLTIAVGDSYYIIMISLAVIGLIYLFVWLNRPRRKDYVRTIGIFAVCCLFIISVDTVFGSLEVHQQNRIKVLLDPSLDLRGTGYNVHQAKIAIGSGGFKGKGFLNGTITKANFLPEQETDFIFCTVGEEWGFVGCLLLLGLYLWLLQRLVSISERQASRFSRFYGYSVSAILFFHILVNVGMVIGLVPVIGIPLPFFSYGGSSLLAFTILLFILLRQDAEHTSLL